MYYSLKTSIIWLIKPHLVGYCAALSLYLWDRLCLLWVQKYNLLLSPTGSFLFALCGLFACGYYLTPQREIEPLQAFICVWVGCCCLHRSCLLSIVQIFAIAPEVYKFLKSYYKQPKYLEKITKKGKDRASSGRMLLALYVFGSGCLCLQGKHFLSYVRR